MLHHFTKPLGPRPAFSTDLPRDVYAAVVGTIDGPIGYGNADHVLFPVRLSTGEYTGLYQLAFNTEDNDQTSVQFFVRDEVITMADVPGEGFTTDASLSYSEIGLHQKNFTTVTNGMLRMLVHSSAQDADLVSAYGVTYSDGTGMHDLHYNNGEPPDSGYENRPNQDGALAFYSLNRSGQTSRRWIFIKFQTQSLP